MQGKHNTCTRRRRDKKAKPVGTDGSNATKDHEETLWEVLMDHPLVKVSKYIFLPYALYLSYFYLQLQHPEYLSKATGGIIQLRPAVGISDLRQLLIVGTPSSGTVQMQTTLQQLRLEIGHETTDTAWNWVRDGTVSWFHGIRFLTDPTHKDKERLAKAFSAICDAGEDHMNMGFHPAAYREPVNKCSYRSKWSDCWRKECYLVLIK